MRNTAFLAFGVALIILQSIAHVALDRLPLAGITPNLLLPLVIFMGVHEYSIARGAALSFILGYLLDVFAGAPVGLFTAISVATFFVARLAGVRLAAQTLVTKVALAFVFALFQGILVVVLTAILGNDPTRARWLASLVPADAIAAAIVAPVVFRFAERIHLATVTSLPAEGQGAR
jgi:rod shape-determining protein MreD